MKECDSIIEYIEKNIKYTNKVKYLQYIKYYFEEKIFAIVYVGEESHIILKADGKFNIAVRKEFKKTVFPSYVINKYHWNMILIGKELPVQIICRLIETSKEEVIDTMTKRQKDIYDYLLNSINQ